MKRHDRLSFVLITALAAVSLGWPLKPTHARGQAGQPQCAKPPQAQCGDKSIVVHGDGLHGNDGEIFVCAGDHVDWQVDTAAGDVAGFTIHFDENPFDRNFGSGDYCGGNHCPGHPSGTDKLPAHAKDNSPDYVRCHKYTLTVVPVKGSTLTIDPHVIVGGTGNQ
jgi:hypothetical protein